MIQFKGPPLLKSNNPINIFQMIVIVTKKAYMIIAATYHMEKPRFWKFFSWQPRH